MHLHLQWLAQGVFAVRTDLGRQIVLLVGVSLQQNTRPYSVSRMIAVALKSPPPGSSQLVLFDCGWDHLQVVGKQPSSSRPKVRRNRRLNSHLFPDAAIRVHYVLGFITIERIRGNVNHASSPAMVPSNENSSCIVSND